MPTHTARRIRLPAAGRYNPAVTVRSDDSDTAFAALLDRRSGVRLVDVLDEIAADLDRRHGSFDFLGWLDDLTQQVRAAQAEHLPVGGGTVLDRADVLFYVLAESGFGRLEADYDDYRSSLPRHIATQGTGLPIVLSLIAEELGSRVGVPLAGIATPGHFMLRLETDDETLYFDAYRGGRVRGQAELVDWLSGLTGYPPEMILPTLVPAKPRVVIIRVLENLKRVLIDSEDWPRAYTVQSRLLALRPGSRGDRRDLAAIAAHGPAPGESLKLLPFLLTDAEDREKPLLDQIAKRARHSLIALN